ncbi:hypothetical protein LOD99_11782 [Oopsacas minuta]|uniref:Uncharacterized protein n=1 Tax=Oopsacas minuta TaxID=111878 RepID=A0AAV7JL22_9METZ|nr:hypothetical protein LOD99_11782 [Oopsacas minuta]
MEPRMASHCQILFSGCIKKLSRKLFWQNRIITLNSLGEIYITTEVISSFQNTDTNSMPPINITESGVWNRPGDASDGLWPQKLDLRQSMVLECSTTRFLFFPSILAAEEFTNQLDILSNINSSSENIQITPEMVTNLDNNTNSTEKLKYSSSNDVISSDKEATILKHIPGEDTEVCFDFRSGPGYLTSKHTLDNNASTHDSKRTPFTPISILKQSSENNNNFEEKTETIKRVRFDTSTSVRIVNVMNNNTEAQADTDNLLLCINKYIIKSHKQKYQTENRANLLSNLMHKFVK